MIDAWPKVRGEVREDRNCRGNTKLSSSSMEDARRSSLVASKIVFSISRRRGGQATLRRLLLHPSFLPTISYNFFDPTLPSLGVHG